MRVSFYNSIIVCALLIIGLITLSRISNINNNKFLICDSELQVKNNLYPDLTLNIFMSFSFAAKYIYVRLEGVLIKGSEKKSISRYVRLKIENLNHNKYDVVNNENTRSPGDQLLDESLNHMLPAIYSEPNSLGVLILNTQPNGDLILSSGQIPSIYCKKRG